MHTMISTDDVHPRDRFDYWHEILCRQVIRHDCTPEVRQAFRAKLQSVTFSDVDLIYYESTPMVNEVTIRHVAQASLDWLLVRHQIAGAFIVEQDGRETVLEAGDMTLLDPRRPMRGKYLNGARQLVLKLPRRSLEARVGNTQRMIARAIKPTRAEHKLTSAFLAMLPAHAEGLSSATADIVRDQTLDLIAMSLAMDRDGDKPRPSYARSLALFRLRAAIEARLPDPTLHAEAVAAAAGISVRYANAVLADDDGMSIMRLVLARRLERCRIALENPSQGHCTVSEIAYGWGFSDMTHFGRKFRAAYGVAPSEYRQRANPGAKLVKLSNTD
jgi:AraC family transcriptional activator of tynA and feaB